MSDQKKKPAHELLIQKLEGYVKKFAEPPAGKRIGEAYALYEGIALILDVMRDMTILEKHRQEIVEHLRKISAECTNHRVSSYISALADRILKEGKPEEKSP